MLRLLILLSALAATLTGCVSIAAESARQLDEVGDVELTTVICADQPRNGANCPTSVDNSEVTSGTEYQVLMGYRIPSQASPPETVAATDVPLTLFRSGSYTAELQRVAPAPAGQQWVGYMSQPFPYSPEQSEQSATFVARMQLLRERNGGPFPSPFSYRTIVGHRQAQEDPNRPVSCADKIEQSNADGTTCMSYPGPEELATNVTVPTRDVGVIDGAAGTAPRGGSGTVGFAVVFSGEGQPPSFALAPTTTVPGGTVSAPPSVAGTASVPVTVDVPASTPPGVYEVALTATHPSGHSRRGSGFVRVTGDDPIDRAPPELAVRMKSTPRVRRALRIGMVADVSCSESCLVTAQLRAGKRTARRLRLAVPPGKRGVGIGGFREKVHADGRRNVRIRFRRGLGPRLLRARRVTIALRVNARDPAGNARTRTIFFSVRR